MVQASSSGSVLQTSDYLIPLTTIRDTLLRPGSESLIAPSSIAKLLGTSHIDRLRNPWQPYTAYNAATAGKRAIGSNVTIPGTSASFEVTAELETLSDKLAKRADISVTDALVLCRSYELHSLDDDRTSADDGRLARVLAWWSEETVAVAEISTTLLILGTGSEDQDWSEIASGLRETIMVEPEQYLEQLFRAFSTLAQKPLEGDRRSEYPLFWSKHYLRLQSAMLELLFIVLVQLPHRKAAISHALIRGVLLSSFGTVQASRQYWEANTECEVLQELIRDNLILVAIEAMSISTALSSPDAEVDEASLSTSKAHIEFVNQLVLDASEGEYEEETKVVHHDPASPVSLLCLAWSIVLRTLPLDLAPSFSQGEDAIPYQEVASRAFNAELSLFEWIERVLAGPLFPPSEDDDVNSSRNRKATNRRRVFKDMLVGMTELLNVENIPDQEGLHKAWELTFGGASAGTNIMLCADYWQVDYPLDTRRAVLDQSRYPFQPSGLLNVLRALAVPDINDIVAESLFGLDPTHHACDYFNSFSNATFVTPSSAYTLTGNDLTGRKLVRSTQVITLPGGVDLPRGTTGVRLTGDELPPVITWNMTMPGWKLLIETMRAAAGLPATAFPSSDGTATKLSVADLYSGTEPPSSTEVLSSGFKFLTAILRPSSSLTLELLRVCAPDAYTIHPLVEISLSVLANFEPSYDPSLAVDALRLMANLVVAPEANAWQALKSSAFFGGYGRKRSPASTLLQASQKGEHSIALAFLRLVISLVETAPRAPEGDSVLQSALNIIFTEIWSVFPGWRYSQVATKFEIASLLLEILDTVLRNPMSRHGDNVTPAAQTVTTQFVSDASPLTYRPIIDVITQAASTLRSMVARHHEEEARRIIDSVDKALTMLSSLFRLASSLKTPSTALPFGIMSATVISPTSQKMQLFDYLLELTGLPSTQPLTTLLSLKTARTYLEAIAPDVKRPSVAGQLRDPVTSFAQLGQLADKAESADTRAAAWQLLSTMIVTQRGCATAVVSTEQLDSLEGILKSAVAYITGHCATYLDQPHAMAAVLHFLQAVFDCPSLDRPIALLRKEASFWEAIGEIALRLIPSPPTFQLSMHADDFAARIWQYAYSVQAKANATAVLATELGLSVEIDGPETKAQSLVLSLFRNATNLTEAAALASHTSCDPRLHEEQLSRLKDCGWGLNGLRTIALPAEREYGSNYLYDVTPTIPFDARKQSTVNLAVDMFNLNWSMLDADIALTKSMHSLVERISYWTQGDGLSATACLKASITVAELLAAEDRGGDVMLAIQTERLGVLAALLETALDTENDQTETSHLIELLQGIKKIIDNSAFPPVSSLRHADLPALHRPVLRILFLVFQSLATHPKSDLQTDTLLEEAIVFVMEAADSIFDSVIRGHDCVGDLGLVIGSLCGMTKIVSTRVWLDRMSETNLIGRSLEIVTRTKIIGSTAPHSNGKTIFVPSQIPLVLLFHLALATDPLAAEKLAVSGVLAAYSDNGIALAAETAQIVPPVETAPYTLHGSWYSMLLVVKALLSSLPDSRSFIRSDITPFIRVGTEQMLRAVTWTGDSPLTTSALDEMQITLDIFYGISQAVSGGSDGILSAIGGPLIELLSGMREAFEHPLELSQTIVPSSEEEYHALGAELDALADKQANIDLVALLDQVTMPVVSARVERLLRVTATALMTLVNLTRVWPTLKDGERIEDTVLHSADEIVSAQNDPVGILNDLGNTVASIFERSPAATSVRPLLLTLLELCALLSSAQLLTRKAVYPGETEEEDDVKMPEDKGRRASLGDGGELKELVGDLMTLLGDEETAGEGVLGWLRKLMWSCFETDE